MVTLRLIVLEVLDLRYNSSNYFLIVVTSFSSIFVRLTGYYFGFIFFYAASLFYRSCNLATRSLMLLLCFKIRFPILSEMVIPKIDI